jgi:hypothetical protein
MPEIWSFYQKSENYCYKDNVGYFLPGTYYRPLPQQIPSHGGGVEVMHFLLHSPFYLSSVHADLSGFNRLAKLELKEQSIFPSPHLPSVGTANRKYLTVESVSPKI